MNFWKPLCSARVSPAWVLNSAIRYGGRPRVPGQGGRPLPGWSRGGAGPMATARQRHRVAAGSHPRAAAVPGLLPGPGSLGFKDGSERVPGGFPVPRVAIQAFPGPRTCSAWPARAVGVTGMCWAALLTAQGRAWPRPAHTRSLPKSQCHSPWGALGSWAWGWREDPRGATGPGSHSTAQRRWPSVHMGSCCHLG